jgi:4-amino-4-deoxy-L-arabinose transferase-like glycosyltransferase
VTSSPPASESPIKRLLALARNEWLLLALITLVALSLRVYRLDTIPLGLHSDEGFNGYEARRVLEERRPYVFFEEELGEEPMHIDLVALFFALFGQSPFVIRLTSAVLGTITVPLLYLLTKELFRSEHGARTASRMGLMAALWLALSYWHLNYSRLGMEPITLPLMLTVTAFFFWRALRTGKTLHYALCGLMLGLTVYTYRASRLVPFLFVLYVPCYLLLTRRLDKRLLLNWVVLFGVALAAFLPLGYFALTHSDIYFSRAGDVSIFNPEYNGGSPLRAFLTSVVKTAASFHLLPDPNWRQNPAHRPLLDSLTGLLFVVGLVLTIVRWRKPQYLFILFWLAVMSLPAVLSLSGVPHSSRSIGLLPLACILPAIGLQEAMEWPRLTRSPAVLSRLVLALAAMVFLVAGISTCHDYFGAWDNPELPLAFDVPFVEAAEAMNELSPPDGVWILPLTSLAEPGSAHYTVEFLYRGEAPHHFLRTDEDTVAAELTAITQGMREAWVVEWDPDALGGAYLYHADPKGVLPFLLDKYGTQLGKQEFPSFDVVSYHSPPHPHFAIVDAFSATSVRFADQISLTGVAFGGSLQAESNGPADVNEPLLPSGQDAWVTLQWQALSAPNADYKAAVYLVDSRGRVLAQMDKALLSNGLEMTSRWQPGQTELGYYTLVTPPATPPGEYFVEVAVYNAETTGRLPVLDQEGHIAGQSERVGSLRVIRSGTPAQVQPQSPVSNGDLGPGIRLLGYDLPQREVEPGGVLRLALYWEALTDVDTDHTLSLELSDGEGRVEVTQTEPPIDGTYPTTEWQAGDVLRDWHDLAVPPEMPQGEYQLSLNVLDGGSIRGQASLGTVTVRGRPHYFEIPEIQYPLEITLGGSVRLLGYDLNETQVQAGGVLSLTLYWQAMGTTETSYTVFTHLLDPQSQVRGQHDSIPSGGALPTTSWIDGEVISDLYDLTVDADAPPGDYLLEIGMYDAATGERLPVYDAAGTLLGDRLLLPSPVVVQ